MRGVPETHLTFDYLPKNNNRIIVFGFGAGRISPELSGTYEIHVFFAEPDINDPNLKRFELAKKFKRYVPLTDFRFFGIGNVFKNQKHVGYNRHGKTFKAKDVTNHCVSDLSFHNDRANLTSQHSFEERLPDYSLQDPHITLNQRGPSIYVPPMESVRFFLSSFGHFSAQYISDSTNSFSPLKMCDPDSTGWIGNDCVQVAPIGDYCDVSSAVQLAVIMTNVDLAQMAASLASMCEKMRLTEKTVTGFFRFPEKSKNIELVALEHILHANGFPVSQALICRRILSDNRRMPFKELKLILPCINSKEDEDGSDEANKRPSKKYGSLKSINIRKGSSNKNKGSFSWGNLPGLIESFPGLQDISLTISRRKSSEPCNTVRRSGGNRTVTASSSTMTGPVITPAINFKPPFFSRQLFGGVPYEAGEKQELFQRLLRNLPREIAYGKIASELSDESIVRFETLFDTFTEFIRKEHWDYQLKGIRKFVLETPREWGGWAKINKNRGRYVAGIELHSNRSISYVFDAELKNKNESIALGHITPTNGAALGLYEFGCILSHCVTRVKLRGQKRKSSDAYIGMWPDETEYSDVTGGRVSHTVKNRHPYYLAKELEKLLT